MSVKLHYNLSAKAIETPSTVSNWATGGDITHEIPNICGFLDGSSTADTDIVWSDTRTVPGTKDTLDLTAITRPSPFTVLDLTGYKLRFIAVKAAATNTGYIGVWGTVVNPYPIYGATTSKIRLYAGEGALLAVSAAAKTLEVTDALASGATYSIVTVWGDSA